MMAKTSREAAREKLSKLAPGAAGILEKLTQEEHRTKCPECSKWITVPIPSQLALKAATAVLDRSGLGPQQKVSHERTLAPPSSVVELGGLVEELMALPLEDRVSLAQSILPELQPSQRRLDGKPSSSDGATILTGDSS